MRHRVRHALCHTFVTGLWNLRQRRMPVPVRLPNNAGNFQEGYHELGIEYRCTAIAVNTMGSSESKPISSHVWKAYVISNLRAISINLNQ